MFRPNGMLQAKLYKSPWKYSIDSYDLRPPNAEGSSCLHVDALMTTRLFKAHMHARLSIEFMLPITYAR